MEAARISCISIAPVKGLALALPGEIVLGQRGVAENRRLHIIDPAGRLVNGKQRLRLMLVRAELDLEAGTLALHFPDGSEVAAEIELGEPNTTIFFGRPVEGRLVVGPWGRALTDYVGDDLRLVMSDAPCDAGDRGFEGGISLISSASVSDIARAGGAAQLDPRRFRMLFEVDGVEAYAEESWIGHDVQIGEAVVRPLGHVGRCVVTTCDPDTAVRDFDTLRVLATHREGVETDEPLPLGVFGEVVTPGRVRLGDTVLPF